MYTVAAQYNADSTTESTDGPAPGKTTLTSRLAANGNAPAGESPLPLALTGLVGLRVSASGHTAVLEPDASFMILAAPPGSPLLGRAVRATDPEPAAASLWAELASRLQVEAPGASTPVTAGASMGVDWLGGLWSWLLPIGCAPGAPGPTTGTPAPGGASPGGPATGGPATGAPAPPAPADPIADAKRKYATTDTIARLMISDELTIAQFRELRTRVERALSDEPDGHGSLGPDLVAKEGARLRELLGGETMTQDEIAWAHEIIPHQPEAERGDLYQQLQAKAPYANERDNEARRPRSGNKVEGSHGNMCNLTSLAMCLQYLGVPKPTEGLALPEGTEPESLQYEDALYYVWEREGRKGGDIIAAQAWDSVCEASDIAVAHSISFDCDGRKASWERVIRDAHLRAGHAVMVGLDDPRHVVRVQDVTDAGLVVDDPYRQSTGPAGGWDGPRNQGPWPGDEDNAPTAGSDCDWPWPANQTIPIRWYYVVQRS